MDIRRWENTNAETNRQIAARNARITDQQLRIFELEADFLGASKSQYKLYRVECLYQDLVEESNYINGNGSIYPRIKAVDVHKLYIRLISGSSASRCRVS